MTIEELTSIEQLQSIEDLWIDLWQRDRSATPFQSPHWALPWFRHFGSGEILTVIAREKDRLEALAPTIILRDDDDPSESLGILMGTGHTDYLDMLSTSAAPVDAMLTRLAEADCAMWDFQQLRESSLLLTSPAPSHREDIVENQDACLVLSIEGAGEALANITSSHFRKKLRYYRRSLEREGTVTFTTPTAETLDAFMLALFDLHGARWKVRGLPGMLADSVDRSFHREVARCMLGAGALRMHAMHLNDRIIAIFYGFAHHGTVYYYLGGYDPALERLSPGTIVVAHAIEQAAGEGATTFDFLRGAEDYKYAWGARDRWNRRRQLIRTE